MITPVYPNESVDDADKRLVAFTKEIVPVLNEFLPKYQLRFYEVYAVRFSLCCGRLGCRRRVLPSSVLFWGRRVYWAALLLVVPALRQGRSRGYTVRRLQALFGLTRPPLARWISYFQQQFPQSRGFRRLSGRLMPPVAI